MILGDYRLLEKIGAGGMGEVWRAENIHTKVACAVKLLPQEAAVERNFVARFFDEGRLMQTLDHPNIVRVHHVGHDPESGRYYLVMDFVATADGDSCSLHDLLKTSSENRLPESHLGRWSRQVAEALAYAHEQGVVHRDIKPANVLIDAKGNAKVTDFGLAKVIGEDYLKSQIHLSIRHSMAGGAIKAPRPRVVSRQDSPDSATPDASIGDAPTMDNERQTGGRSSADALLGTYDYMSPEQRGDIAVQVSPASDVYAFGVMLYRLLTGRRPTGMARPVSQVVPGLSKTWDAIIARCLEHEPADRFADGGALLAALKKRSPRNALRAGRWLLGLAAAGLLAVGGWAGYQAWSGSGLGKDPPSNPGLVHNDLITNLKQGAEAALATGNMADALDKISALRGLDAIKEANELQEKYDYKEAEPKVNAKYQEASMAWGEAQKLDAGEGFAEKQRKMEAIWTQTETERKNKNWSQALRAYGKLLEECSKLKELNNEREQAKDERAKATQAQRNAANNNDNARIDTSTPFASGNDKFEQATQLFADGNFQEAGKVWKNAAEIFVQAGQHASDVQNYRQARQAFEDDSKRDKDLLEKHGGDKWKRIKKNIASTSIDDPIAGARVYESARSDLSDAIKEANDQARTAEKQARIDALLSEAHSAQRAEQWETCLLKVGEALEIQPGNSQALELKRSAEAAKQPRGVPKGFRVVGRDVDHKSNLPMTIEHINSGYRLKLAPAGSFLMGSPAGEGFDREHPQRRLNMSAFWIGETQVTCEQAARFLNEKGNQTEDGVEWFNIWDGGKIEKHQGKYRAKPGYEQHPVVAITWYGAKALAQWMGGDLPTEAQWEKAARGGKDTRYPWGNEWDPRKAATAERIAKVHEFKTDDDWLKWWEPYQKETLAKRNDYSNTTVPVMTYPANGYGLYGMAGNVWEWCRDWYVENQYERWYDGLADPVNEARGDMQDVTVWQGGKEKTERAACRVVRGGGWSSRAAGTRCAYRYGGRPSFRSAGGGVRVVAFPRP